MMPLCDKCKPKDGQWVDRIVCSGCFDNACKERDKLRAEIEELASMARQSGMGYYDLILSEFPEIVAGTPRIAAWSLIRMMKAANLKVRTMKPVVDAAREYFDIAYWKEGYCGTSVPHVDRLDRALEAYELSEGLKKPRCCPEHAWASNCQKCNPPNRSEESPRE